MAEVAAAIGIHGFWGLSSAFDCSAALASVRHPAIDSAAEASDGREPDVLRVLLVHPGDLRHVMATVTRRLRGGHSGGRPPAIHFYVLESPMEVLARDILLWEVFLDFEIPIRQRANLFLELYGNAKVQDRTSRYVERLGDRLRALVTRGASTLDLIDLSLLKYRDKDELENIFKSYSRSNVFDTDGLRNQRMRGYYAERYDSRRAMYDWDYQYGIHSHASLIHIKLFRDWRESGVAFEFGDQVYAEANRTLMSYTEGVMKKGKEKGMKKEIRGFWGDIVCSPYFGFGVDSETPGKFEEGLFEILNKGTGTEQHRHHCVEVAVYNLLAMMWEAETGRQYRMTKAHDLYSGLGSVQPEDAAPVTDGLGTIAEGADEAGGEAGVDEAGAQVATRGGGEEPIPPRVDGTAPSERLKEKIAQRKREEQIAKEIARAEAIVATFDGVKIFPMHGNPSSVLDKAQFESFFDVMFVSNRAAKFLDSPVANRILRVGNGIGAALVAVETGKCLVPLLKKTKAEFLQKELDYCESHQWIRLNEPPVFRRHRDAEDVDDDVVFFAKTTASSSKEKADQSFGNPLESGDKDDSTRAMSDMLRVVATSENALGSGWVRDESNLSSSPLKHSAASSMIAPSEGVLKMTVNDSPAVFGDNLFESENL